VTDTDTHKREPLTLGEVQAQCGLDSQRWFPATSQNVAFMTLALCGEAGELANLIKKVERGSSTVEESIEAVHSEIVDVLIYVANLANATGLDLEQAYIDKRSFNEQRFGIHV
jgi:NTP pyrophosphatase (non-canonical NTP hydrolase)